MGVILSALRRARYHSMADRVPRLLVTGHLGTEKLVSVIEVHSGLGTYWFANCSFRDQEQI